MDILAIVPILALAAVSALFLVLFMNASKIIERAGSVNAGLATFMQEKVFTDNTFLWSVTFVFMAVSVAESGDFFNDIIRNNLFGVLGYASAFVIDLVAITSMKARLRAIRMRDKKGEHLYLFGVWVCASISAFANVTTALSGYNHNAFLGAPQWIQVASPWIGIVFPLLIVLISITADHVLDENPADKVKDLNVYKQQEEKRVKILEIRQDIEEDLLKLEKRIEETVKQRGTMNPKKVFILSRFLFREPMKNINVEQSVNDAMKKLEGVHSEQLSTQSNAFSQQVHSLQQTIYNQQIFIENCMREIVSKKNTDEVFTQATNEFIVPVSSRAVEPLFAGSDASFFEWSTVDANPLETGFNAPLNESDTKQVVEPDEEDFDDDENEGSVDTHTEGLPVVQMSTSSAPTEQQSQPIHKPVSRGASKLRRKVKSKRSVKVSGGVVQQFIADERNAGREPSISQIVKATNCSQGTASNYKNAPQKVTA